MKRDLLDILRCPVHKTELKLSVTKEDPQEILEGRLTCEKCKFDYPIEDGIPNLLPPELQTKA